MIITYRAGVNSLETAVSRGAAEGAENCMR